ncbi:hypothetical protein EAF04_002875 [Stromatinia cepivora]|nr:hypothetical protein EAF04_002875 [Stromatinia cepivora]
MVYHSRLPIFRRNLERHIAAIQTEFADSLTAGRKQELLERYTCGAHRDFPGDIVTNALSVVPGFAGEYNAPANPSDDEFLRFQIPPASQFAHILREMQVRESCRCRSSAQFFRSVEERRVAAQAQVAATARVAPQSSRSNVVAGFPASPSAQAAPAQNARPVAASSAPGNDEAEICPICHESCHQGGFPE